MGLDMFPEDIQNDILALSQKIVEYAQAVAQSEEVEESKGFQQSGPDYFPVQPLTSRVSYLPPTRYKPPRQKPLGFWEKLAKCDRTAPGQISRDAFNNAMMVGGMLGMTPKTAPFALGGALTAAIGTLAGGNLGHMVGCMSRAHFR